MSTLLLLVISISMPGVVGAVILNESQDIVSIRGKPRYSILNTTYDSLRLFRETSRYDLARTSDEIRSRNKLRNKSIPARHEERRIRSIDSFLKKCNARENDRQKQTSRTYTCFKNLRVFFFNCSLLVLFLRPPQRRYKCAEIRFDAIHSYFCLAPSLCPHHCAGNDHLALPDSPRSRICRVQRSARIIGCMFYHHSQTWNQT